MKSASSITLSKAWWKKEAPEGLKKSGGAFEKALEEVSKAEGGSGARAAEALEAALAKLEAAAKQVASEAKDLEKKAKDKGAKTDLANTQAVMGKPLAKAVAALRAQAQAQAQAAGGAAEEAGQFTDPAAHAAFIKKWAPRIKRGQVSFAVCLPSNKPEEMRFNFHASKDGRGLAGILKKEVGATKFTFGKAGSAAMAEEAGEEGVGARTLCLHLEGRQIPGLAKRVRIALKKLGVSQFSKVQILEGGQEIEGSDESETDDAVPEMDLSVPDPDPETEGAPAPEAPPELAPEPAPEPVAAAEDAEEEEEAVQAARRTPEPAPEAPPPPIDPAELQRRYAAAFQRIKPMLKGMAEEENALVTGALKRYGQALKSADLPGAKALVEAFEERAYGNGAPLRRLAAAAETAAAEPTPAPPEAKAAAPEAQPAPEAQGTGPATGEADPAVAERRSRRLNELDALERALDDLLAEVA